MIQATKLLDTRLNDIVYSPQVMTIPPGLAHGKMGMCLYLFHRGRAQNDDHLTDLAGRLLNQILSTADRTEKIDIESGLMGTGLGLVWLFRNRFVAGDENSTLRDIDDEIFHQASFTEYAAEDTALLIQSLLYFSVRRPLLRGEQARLWDALAAQTLNTLHSKLEEILSHEVIYFRLDHSLPLFLFALSRVWETGVGHEKIERIICDATPFILSKWGYRDSLRLHLLWGLGHINKHLGDSRLAEHCALLASKIDFDALVAEFPTMDVSLTTGLAGVCLLALTMDESSARLLDLPRFFAVAPARLLIPFRLSDMTWGRSGLNGYSGVVTILENIEKRTRSEQ